MDSVIEKVASTILLTQNLRSKLDQAHLERSAPSLKMGQKFPVLFTEVKKWRPQEFLGEA